MPGPVALTYFVLGTVLAVIAHVAFWASATFPVGTVSTNVLLPAFAIAWFGWLLSTLNRVARETFDEFRPALNDAAAEEGYRRRLTSIRDRDAILAGLATLAVIGVMYYGFVRQSRLTLPIEIESEIFSAPLWGAMGFVLGIVVLHTIVQLRLVSHLSEVAGNVDIFRPAPINAFSRLTAVSALGLIAFVVAYMLYTPEQPLRIRDPGDRIARRGRGLIRPSAQGHEQTTRRREETVAGRRPGAAEDGPRANS